MRLIHRRASAKEMRVDSARPTRTLERIGLQLYTVRAAMARDFDGTLARVAAIGYREVEFAGYFDHAPADVRASLDRHGLSAPSAHIGTAATLTKDWARTLEAAQAVGHKYLVVAGLAERDRRTLDDYRRVADLFNTAGESARRMGMRLAYHNHDFEFTPMARKLPYDILLERTDPALVAMEMDLFWVTKAGQKPLAWFDRYPGRFEMVHLKDMDGSPERRMVDIGRGTIDFARIFANGAQAGTRHYFVEHDDPQPPALASAKASYEALSRMQLLQL